MRFSHHSSCKADSLSFSSFLRLFFIFLLKMSSEKMLLGGHKQKDPEDKEIKEILHKAVTIHNSKSNDENIIIVKITEVTSQVVAGIKYKISFVGEGETSKKQYNVHVDVLSQPWANPEPQLLSINFNPIQ